MKRDVVVIGGSAGGIKGLLEIARTLRPMQPPTILTVVHIQPHAPSVLPELVTRAGFPAVHPLDGEPLERGRMYVAPPDNHLVVAGDSARPRCSVARGPKENGHRPSIDALFRSAAAVFGPRVVGVVLSGLLDCGSIGLVAIKARNGLAVAQDPDDAEFPDMPSNAINAVDVDHVLPLVAIGPLLQRLLSEDIPAESVEQDVADPLAAKVPIAISCPECHGPLVVQVVGRHVEVLRCHVGHVFSSDSIEEAQAVEIERSLWSAVRALDEDAALVERMASAATGDRRARLEERRRAHQEDSRVLRSLLVRRRHHEGRGS